jgi:formate dehydrogenase subunit gamma
VQVSPTIEEQRGAIDAAIQMHGATEGGLLPALHEVHDRVGYVPDAAVALLASAFSLSRAEVEGVISFYHDFRRAPSALHVVKVCRGEACQAMGANELIDSVEASVGCKLGETSTTNDITLDAVYCLGNCALAPAAMINGKLLGRATERRIASAISQRVSR